ncbi:MAG: DNA polymerase III subunit delta' [Armatimonadota bacterium]
MKFADIKSQETAVRVLSSSIKRSTVAHAYLFTGPRKTGKTSTALAFAASLNCSNPTPDGDGCGICLSCVRMESGLDSDLMLITPEGNQTKMEQVQEMIRNLNYAPIEGKYKVVIIEQADTLNPSSENSILKILEEPPAYAVLILLSSNPNSLLPTIRSRCRKVRFRSAGVLEIADYLKSHIGLADDQAQVIAACSQGAIGKALQLSSESNFMEERHGVIQALNRWISGPPVLSLSTAELLRSIAEPRKNDPDTRVRVRRLTDMLDYVISWYADLLALKARGEKAVLANCDYQQNLYEQVNMYSTDRLVNSIRSIMDTRRYLEGNITPQLALECMFFDLRPDKG